MPPRPASHRTVVTGAAGFIGSHVVEALAGAGRKVVAVDALSSRPYPATRKRQTFARLAALPGVHTVVADLRTADVAALAWGAEAIVHLAALAGLRDTACDPAGAWAHNVEATRRLAAAAAHTGARFVLASTSSVYGAHAVGDEAQPQRPVSMYGRTKQAAEQVVLRAAAAGELDAVVVRYFSVYGPRQRPDMAYSRFISAMLDDRPITVHGDGHQRRSITDVDDVVGATVAALDHGRSATAYNVGGGTTVSVLEAIDLIGAAVGTRPQLRFAPVPAGDQVRTQADTSLAARDLGWSPKVEPWCGIRRQVDWHRRRRRALDERPALALAAAAHS